MMMRRAAFLIAVSLVLTTFVPDSRAAGKIPLKPGPKDKCAVCGMLVSPYQNWLSVVVLKDGTRAFFDGPKDLFKYLFNVGRYTPGKSRGDIESISVTDYYSLIAIDAHKAWFVTGSDVNGPMGEELVPFAKEADARAFLRDHKGKIVLTFDAITAETVAGHGGSHNVHGK